MKIAIEQLFFAVCITILNNSSADFRYIIT